MMKVIVMALFFGTVFGVGVGTYFGRFDAEGVMMGVLSVTCIAVVTSVMFFVDQKKTKKVNATIYYK